MESKHVDVATDPTVIHENATDRYIRVKVKRASDLTGTVLVGGPSVSASEGYTLSPGEADEWILGPDEGIYGIHGGAGTRRVDASVHG